MATLIQRYDKKSFHFKNERLTEILQAATFYRFIKLDNKMSIFEEYAAFKTVSRNATSGSLNLVLLARITV